MNCSDTQIKVHFSMCYKILECESSLSLGSHIIYRMATQPIHLNGLMCLLKCRENVSAAFQKSQPASEPQVQCSFQHVQCAIGINGTCTHPEHLSVWVVAGAGTGADPQRESPTQM